MIFPVISLVLIVAFVFWLGLNPLIGVMVGLQMAVGLNRKTFLKYAFEKPLKNGFFTLFLSSRLWL